jgi:hypothetical protein
MLGYASADELMDANIVADVFADASIASRILTELNEHGQVLDAECELRRKSGDCHTLERTRCDGQGERRSLSSGHRPQRRGTKRLSNN